jgi:ABC-type lipoprotein release transport system permease subunit
MSLPLRIAWRYLMSKKGHQAVNVISIVAVCGIVVATAALICVLSVFNGFRGLIMGKLAMLDPEVAITATMGKTINNADSIIDAVSGIPGVERAVPVIEDQALAMYAQLQMPVRLKGVPDDYNTMNQMDSVIVDGQWKLRDQV